MECGGISGAFSIDAIIDSTQTGVQQDASGKNRVLMSVVILPISAGSLTNNSLWPNGPQGRIELSSTVPLQLCAVDKVTITITPER